MTPEQRSELKQIMAEELQAITEEVNATADTSKTAITPDSAIGRISRVEAMQTRHIGEASARARRARISLIKSALKEIDDDEYGYCEACEEAIPFARLKLIPEATLCVKCASSIEI